MAGRHLIFISVNFRFTGSYFGTGSIYSNYYGQFKIFRVGGYETGKPEIRNSGWVGHGHAQVAEDISARLDKKAP